MENDQYRHRYRLLQEAPGRQGKGLPGTFPRPGRAWPRMCRGLHAHDGTLGNCCPGGISNSGGDCFELDLDLRGEHGAVKVGNGYGDDEVFDFLKLAHDRIDFGVSDQLVAGEF